MAQGIGRRQPDVVRGAMRTILSNTAGVNARVTQQGELVVATKSGSSGVGITFSDTGAIDPFNRLRVSNPQGLFDSTLTYDSQPLFWNESLTGTGTATHLPGESAVIFSLPASGDAVVRQTREYYRYQAGKGQLILATFALRSGDANVRKRVGYFDADNGLFLEEINGSLWFVRRSNATGTPVDTRIAQADWNIDTYSDLDPTKAQILVIDLEWLGVGRVRMGFVIDGLIRYAHEFLHANVVESVYMSTAQLPMRYEAVATGAPSATNTMKQICSAVISEGGQEESAGLPFGARSAATKSISGSKIPLVSIRPKTTFNSIENHVKILQRQFEATNVSNGVAAVDILYNATLTNASFNSVGANSAMEFDVAATASSGGIVIQSFFIASQGSVRETRATDSTGVLPLGLDIAGANPTPLTIAVTDISGSVDCLGAINWQEYR